MHKSKWRTCKNEARLTIVELRGAAERAENEILSIGIARGGQKFMRWLVEGLGSLKKRQSGEYGAAAPRAEFLKTVQIIEYLSSASELWATWNCAQEFQI
jgi:hypothetical protein